MGFNFPFDLIVKLGLISVCNAVSFLLVIHIIDIARLLCNEEKMKYLLSRTCNTVQGLLCQQNFINVLYRRRIVIFLNL